MSDQVRKPGNFVLFKNDYKEKDNQPDYKSPTKEGKRGLDLEGKEIEVACWVNKSKDGVSYMSCQIQYPQNKTTEDTAPVEETPVAAVDPDLPF